MNNQPIDTGISRVQPPLRITIQAKIKEVWNKFYGNKKIFWPVTVVIGLLLLTIIAGLLFGTGKTGARVKSKATPTLSAEATPRATPTSNILTTASDKLTELKKQIIDLDVYQKRLKPPVINYKIRF